MRYSILIIVITLLFIYLNRSYALFYDNIGKAHLSSPFMEESVLIDKYSDNAEVITYVALGDSLTTGIGSFDYKNTYPYILTDKIANKEKKVIKLINLAIPGAKTEDVIIKELPNIKQYNPKYISLLIGINNIHAGTDIKVFEKEFEEILIQLSALNCQVYIINIPVLGSTNSLLFPYDKVRDYQTNNFNKIIYNLTLKYRLNYIDLYKSTKDSFNRNKDNYSSDLFHPSDKGYIYWSKYLEIK